MKKILILFANILLVLGFNIQASSWTYVSNQGDTGWQTYTYTAGPEGFTGVVGFVVSNVIDNSAYSELLLDNLSQGGGAEGINRGFEQGNLSGYDLVGQSFATVSSSATSISGTTYNPTQGDSLADLQGLSDGVTTSQFYNAPGQAGTVGSILETEITLDPGGTFSFDWAFLGNDQSPWDDFALFYLKDQSGAIVFSEGLAQIGSASSCNAYDYKFTYANGDYYTGTVYATTEYGYSINYTQTTTDENNQTGNYVITGVTPGFDASKAGQVYVPSYYDYESDQTYTPVSNGTAVGTGYLGSEVDYIIQKDIPEFKFGQGSDGIFYEADVGNISRYDFTFSYSSGSGDYYVGYVYAPTSFQTSGPGLAVGSYLYDQPMEFWNRGYKSLNGGYYYITTITDGFSSSYDKQSYITSYYDANSAKASLGVNTDASSTATYIYVADRTADFESGYAISGSQHAAFDLYTEANVTITASSPASSSPALSSTLTSVNASQSQGQAISGNYWGQTDSLLDEEKYPLGK
jgi:hypothetical protein